MCVIEKKREKIEISLVIKWNRLLLKKKEIQLEFRFLVPEHARIILIEANVSPST